MSAPQRVRPAAVFAAVALAAAGFWAVRSISAGDGPATAPAKKGPPKEPTVGDKPLFWTWPSDRKPDAALVLTGQVHGYIRPCGCSADQKGGLERRANFFAALRARGWPVAGLDLGDVAPAELWGSVTKVAPVREQAELKYGLTLRAMKAMGYAAVGVGRTEVNLGLIGLLARYVLNDPDKVPVVLAANLVGKGADNKVIPRAEQFPGGAAGGRPMVEDVEAFKVGDVSVGVVGAVGKSVAEKLRQLDANFEYLDAATTVADCLKKLDAHPLRPTFRVLLFQGTVAEATRAAEAFPQFQVVQCLSDEQEPPMAPTPANGGKTAVVQVGWKGMYAGVLGAFRTADGFDLKYQIVPLTDFYATPDGPEAEKNHAVLRLLEEYAREVTKENLLALYVAKPQQHPEQVRNPNLNLSYVGSERCAGCHATEYAVWKDSKHSHAMEALEKYANRPGLRNFDGECVACHTVGFGLQSGYTDEKATPHLRHVGCESCHGPGSGHMTNPTNRQLALALSPWKTKPEDRLPGVPVMKKIADLPLLQQGQVPLTPPEKQVTNAVTQMCMKCHDQENDPKFDLYKYMPKIWHSGMKK